MRTPGRVEREDLAARSLSRIPGTALKLSPALQAHAAPARWLEVETLPAASENGRMRVNPDARLSVGLLLLSLGALGAFLWFGFGPLPLCGGECPPERPVCRDVSGEGCACTERLEIPPCQEISTAGFLPLCGGECPPERPICRDIGGLCECTESPDTLACGEFSDPLFLGFPICLGECPPEHICVPGGESCECIEFSIFSCGHWLGLPICAGECPEEQHCKQVEGDCICAPPPG